MAAYAAIALRQCSSAAPHCPNCPRTPRSEEVSTAVNGASQRWCTHRRVGWIRRRWERWTAKGSTMVRQFEHRRHGTRKMSKRAPPNGTAPHGADPKTLKP
eukprot:4618657-Pyramimonas_sp.AAC.1